MPATSQTTEPRHAEHPRANPVFTGRQAVLIAVYTALGIAVLFGALAADRSRAHFIWVILGGLAWIHGGVVSGAVWLYRRLDLDGREARVLAAIDVVAKRLDTLQRGQDDLAERVSAIHDRVYDAGFSDCFEMAFGGAVGTVTRLPTARTESGGQSVKHRT